MMRWPRRLRTPFALVVAAALTLATAGAAPALHPTSGQAGATVAPGGAPKLSANTKAPCNTTPKKGHSRCMAVVRTATEGVITPQATVPPPSALSPADIRSAYNLPVGGSGQTIAIVDAFGYSTAEADLAVYRAHYGLSPCTTANGCFRKVDQRGGTGYPRDDTGWAMETALDLDAVSAVCPSCNILLVEADDNNNVNLGAAVDQAVALGAESVSNSYGSAPDQPSDLDNDHYFNHPGVVVAAASGDVGNLTNWPSTNPNVLAVGGTRLTRDASLPRGWAETAWSSAGSGCSVAEPRPDYQTAIPTGCSTRATADIAADADPVSGLAVYDALGQSGWLQVGGTSLATPLITAMYALAGTPVPGTYPVTYPYHDATQATDLFDVTSGGNGTCGNVVCTAGPGWDGPTGLGTPNGVAALRSGPHGTLTGHVTDQVTGDPVAGATVSADPGNYVTHTDATGTYRFNLEAGSHDITAAAYGYQANTRAGVVVGADELVTTDFALTPLPFATLSGTVTDGSGHGWPLHAAITISGYPNGAVYTDPGTGKYSVRLAKGSYTLQVSTDYPGYQPQTEQVIVGDSNAERDIALHADLAGCTAPGYGMAGLTTRFTAWTGGTPRAGWKISGTRSGWRFDNPGDRPAPENPPIYVSGGDDRFAAADSAASGPMDTTLTSPAVDLSGQDAPELRFDTFYRGAPGESATVQLSGNGGRTWDTVWQRTASDLISHVSVPVPAVAGKADVRVRFHYTGQSRWYWTVDNVFLGSDSCAAQPGGLLIGTVGDQATSKAVYGTQVADATVGDPPGWPSGTARAMVDPGLSGAYYWLFLPGAGARQLTATASGYDAATVTVDVTSGRLVRHDFALTAHGS